MRLPASGEWQFIGIQIDAEGHAEPRGEGRPRGGETSPSICPWVRGGGGKHRDPTLVRWRVRRGESVEPDSDRDAPAVERDLDFAVVRGRGTSRRTRYSPARSASNPNSTKPP